MSPNNNIAIQTTDLSRTFEVRQKAQGLAASFKNFFSPEYRSVHAVNNLDLSIPTGEIVGFLGPNGAGKTTTLKMLAGLLTPTSGDIKVLGYTPFDRHHDFLKSISLVMGQKQNLWWDLPPIETFAIHQKIYQIAEQDFRTRLDELVAMLEIHDCLETQTRKLSLGQRMRCELAVSLLHQPSILFLDEPTIGLDILMQKKIRSFLLDYHRRFAPTILLTSHYMDDVAALAQRVIVIDLGKKVFDDKLKNLTDQLHPEKIISVVKNNSEPWCLENMTGKLVSHEGQVFKFLVSREQAGQLASDLYATGCIADLTIEDPPLEDLIGQLFTSASTPEKPRQDR